MEIIYLLLPLAIGLALVFVVGFVWMTRSGQYDDLETPAHRILLDDQKINLNINKEIK